MAIFKEVWSFQSGTATWSEVYFSSETTIELAAKFDQPFLNKRLDLLDGFNILRKIRVSAVNPPKLSYVVPINQSGLWRSILGSGPANTTEAAVCNLVSTVVPSSRRLWMRGCSENAVSRNQNNGNDVPHAEFSRCLRVWMNALQAAKYIVLSAVKPPAGGIVSSKLKLVDGTSANGQTVLTFEGPLGVVAGDRIVISKANKKDFPGLNGTFTVLLASANLVTIPYATPTNLAKPAITGAGKKVVYQETAIINGAQSGFNFLGGRKTKNVSTGSRGAKSASRIRTLV